MFFFGTPGVSSAAFTKTSFKNWTFLSVRSQNSKSDTYRGERLLGEQLRLLNRATDWLPPPTTTRKCHLWRDRNDLHWKLWSLRIWSSQNSLVVSTLLKNVNQIGHIPQIGVNIKNTFELPPPRFDHPKTVQNGHDASHSSPSQKLHLAVVAVVAFDEVRLHRKSWVPVAIVFAYLYPIFVGQYWKIILQVKLEWNHLTKEEKTTCSWCVWLSKPHSHDLSWLILGKLNPFPNYAKFAEVCPMARWCRISSVYSEETNCCFPIEDVEVFQIFVR